MKYYSFQNEVKLITVKSSMSSNTLIVIEIDGKLLNALEITAWSLQLDQRLP